MNLSDVAVAAVMLTAGLAFVSALLLTLGRSRPRHQHTRAFPR